MARILVNYIYNKQKDEYIIYDGGRVLADMKVAVMETEEDIGRPLVIPIKNEMTVVDRDHYEQVHKKFRFSIDEEGNIKEDSNGLAEAWLPKDTDISRLKYVNGQLVLLEKEQKQEQPKPIKIKPKKENNVNKEA